MATGLDVATLAIRVDGSELGRAGKQLEDFSASGEKAERSARNLGRTVSQDMKREFLAAQQGIQRSVDQLDRIFEREAAEIKVALAQGFITPKEADKLARDAAQAYNQRLASAISARSAAFNKDLKGGTELLSQMSNKFKDVGAEGRRAGLGLGRLNDALVTVARQTTGMNSISGKLIDTVGTFAIGTAYMIPVLAGLAAIGAAWAKLTEDSRKFREEVDNARQALRALAEDQALGIIGQVGQQVATLLQERARIQARIQELQARDRANTNPNVVGNRERIRVERENLAELNEEIEAGLRQIFDTTKREQQRIDRERERAIEERERQLQRELKIEEEYWRKKAALITGRVPGGGPAPFFDQADFDPVTGRVSGRNPVGPLPEVVALTGEITDGFETMLSPMEEFQRALAELGLEADDLISILPSVGGLFGDVGRSIGELAQAAITGNPLAFVGGLAGGIGSIIGAGNRVSSDAARQEQARIREEAKRLADAFAELRNSIVDSLEIRGLEARGLSEEADALRRRMAADKEFEDFISFLDLPAGQNPFLAALPRSARDAAEDAIRGRDVDAIQALIDSLGDFGAEGTLKKLLEDLLELIEVQGLEGEAAEKAAEAQRELAKAEEEAAAAARELTRAMLEGDFLSRERTLAGDDRGAFEARLETRAAQEIADLRKLFEDGVIDEETLNRYINIINGEVTAALNEFDVAAAEATQRLLEMAKAEEYRAQVDLKSLELRRLVALGLDEEAFLLRQKLELEQALFEKRSAEYLALLELVQAEEYAAWQRQRNAQATREQARDLEESTKRIDGFARALNGPAGLILALRRYQTVLGAGAPNALGLRTGAGGGNTININIDGAGKSPSDIANAVVAAIRRTERAGGGNPVVSVLP